MKSTEKTATRVLVVDDDKSIGIGGAGIIMVCTQ